MLRLLVILLGGLLLPLLAAAQSADAIPEALLAESDAVVRLDETETTYTSPTNVVERHTGRSRFSGSRPPARGSSPVSWTATAR